MRVRHDGLGTGGYVEGLELVWRDEWGSGVEMKVQGGME